MPIHRKRPSSNLKFASVKSGELSLRVTKFESLSRFPLRSRRRRKRVTVFRKVPLWLIVRGLSACIARGIFLSDQCFIALAERVIPLGYRKCEPSVCRRQCCETVSDRYYYYVVTLEHVTTS